MAAIAKAALAVLNNIAKPIVSAKVVIRSHPNTKQHAKTYKISTNVIARAANAGPRTRNLLQIAQSSARSRNTKAMAFATTRTMCAAAHGMEVIAVAKLTSIPCAVNANVSTRKRRQRAVKATVPSQNGSTTRYVTIATTFADATGMVATAAAQTVAKIRTSSAQNANAARETTRGKRNSKRDATAIARSLRTRVTGSATTKTTTADVIGMEAIAVGALLVYRTAANASVLILITMGPNALGPAPRRHGRETRCATTVTTTVPVIGTVAIVVVPERATIIATSANAPIPGTNQIPKTVPRGVAKRSPRKLCTAGRMRGKETGFVTPVTTSAAATGMVATVVAVVSAPNTAISATVAASAWTPTSTRERLPLHPPARAHQNPNANFPITTRMVIVMISTTFVSAIGTGGIAAGPKTTTVSATLAAARTLPRSP